MSLLAPPTQFPIRRRSRSLQTLEVEAAKIAAKNFRGTYSPLLRPVRKTSNDETPQLKSQISKNEVKMALTSSLASLDCLQIISPARDHVALQINGNETSSKKAESSTKIDKLANELLEAINLRKRENSLTKPTSVPVTNAAPSNCLKQQISTPGLHITVNQNSGEPLPTNSEKACRFCFEAEEDVNKGKLMKPCKCDGSLKYIHEKCLSTWIMQKEIKHSTIVRCEICGYTYQLEAETRLKLNCQRACDSEFASLLFGLGLGICLINLLCIIFKVMRVHKENPNLPKGQTLEQQQSIYHAMLMVCTFIGIMFFCAMVYKLKTAFFETRIVNVKIYEYDPKFKDLTLPPNYNEDGMIFDSFEQEINGYYDLEMIQYGQAGDALQNSTLDQSNNQLIAVNNSHLA